MNHRTFSLLSLAGLIVACAATDRPSSRLQDEVFEGQTRCAVRPSHLKPLVVEWPAADRADLEVRLARGLVAVRYVGCDMEVIKSCQIAKAYRYTGVAPKRDQMTIRTADELFAALPVGAAKLQAKLVDRGEIVVDMTTAGMYDIQSVPIGPADVTGDCQRATHLIVAASAGAFEMALRDTSERSGGAEVDLTATGIPARPGGGIGRRDAREVLTSDGEPAACGEHAEPIAGCRSLLRVEVAEIAHVLRFLAPVAARPATPDDPPAKPPLGAPQGDGEMVAISAGDFRMGVQDGPSTSHPQHLVRVDAFAIDRFEVTTEEFRACVAAGACVPPAHGGGCHWARPDRVDHPINCVTYADATAYCAWQGKRLPTEIEWEYAAIGNTGWNHPWGPDRKQRSPCTRSACADHDVSVFGVRGMVGTITELTSSPWCAYPDHDCENPKLVVRGEPPKPMSWRGEMERDAPRPHIGFRCARSIDG